MAQAEFFRPCAGEFAGRELMSTANYGRSRIYLIAAIVAAGPTLFFLWYTLRLAYINFAVLDARSHWSDGMLIGAIAFPLAMLLFGSISWICFKRFRQGSETK